MACLQIAISGFSPILGIRTGFPGRRFSSSAGRVLPFRCCRREDDTGSEGKEQPESLFMKELKRRGMTPTSLLEDSSTGRTPYPGLMEEMDLVEEEPQRADSGRGSVKRKGVMSADYEKGLLNQRERSMALNSEGLEGLIPRAKLLLTIGGTFFLGFGPLILVTVAFFSALYFFFGTSFVHDASRLHITPPSYVDPYALLDDDRISQMAPRVK